MADAPGAVAKRTRQGLKLQGAPVSERFGSSCPICWEPWDVNEGGRVWTCCFRKVCNTCTTKTQDSPCSFCRAAPPILSEALAQIRRHAENGVPEAITDLAGAYRYGDYGLVKDMKMAVKLYKRAATLGDADAMVCLGHRYEHGDGVRQSLKKAQELYRTAASRGHYLAQNNLGSCLRQVGKLEEAFAMTMRAAEQGYAGAECIIGCHYRRGVGVEASEASARLWYARSAAKGDLMAQHNLGLMYAFGDGGAVDLGEAKRLFARAAAQGDKAANGPNSRRAVEGAKLALAEVERLIRAAGGDADAASKAGERRVRAARRRPAVR